MNIQSINIFKTGVQKSLGELEEAIMEVLWSAPAAQSARAVTDALQSKKNVSFNAVSTVLNRLEKKQLVSRQAQGKRYFFMPTQSKQEYSRSILDAGLRSLLSDQNLLSAAGIAEGSDDDNSEAIGLLKSFLKKHDTPT